MDSHSPATGFYQAGHDGLSVLFHRLPTSFWVLVGVIALLNVACGFLQRFIYLIYTVFEILPTLATVEDLSSASGDTTICERAHDTSEDAHTCGPDGARERLLGRRPDLLARLAEEGGLAGAGCEKHGGARGDGDVAGALEDRLTAVLHAGKPVTSCPPYAIHAVRSLTGDHLRGIPWYMALSLACSLAQHGALYLGAPGHIAAAAAAAQVLVPVLLCRLYTYWRHVTILAERAPEPEDLGSAVAFFLDWVDHRVGLWSSFRATAVPTFLFAAAGAATKAIVFCVADLAVDADGAFHLHPLEIAKALLVWQVLAWAVVVPAQIVLTRVQASLLPDGKQTIVPFDRTFGVEKARERGYLTVTEAWTSVSGAEWAHIYTALFSAYWSVVVGVLGLVLGFLLQVVALVGAYSWLGLL